MADATSGAAAVATAALPPRPVYLLASFSQRLRARMIDALIVVVPVLGLWAVILPPLAQAAGNDRQLDRDLNIWADTEGTDGPVGRVLFWSAIFVFVIWVSFTVVRAVYEAVFEQRTAGQTPGRRALSIRVMREDGRKVGFWWAIYRTLLVRDLLFGLGGLLTGGLLWLLQYLWPLWDPQRRALHDVVARSRVVKDAEGA